MIVVSDTSPVTALLQVDRCGLLRDLFGEVVLPEAVYTELRRYHDKLPDFLRIERVTDPEQVAVLAATLDQGEAEAIVLAEQLGADLLLMDENTGRQVASTRGIAVTGLLGVLIRAKQVGLIQSVKDVMARLQHEAGFYVSEDVWQVVLRRAGEC